MALRSARCHCPDPSLLTAAQSGVLPRRLAEAVAGHQRHCAPCQVLARDLTDPELTAPGRLEASRIWRSVSERVAASPPQAPRPWRSLRLSCLATASAAATIVTVVVAGWWTFGTLGPPPTVPAPRLEVTQYRTPRLAFEKPPVALPLASVLTWRDGQGTGADGYLAQLAHALTPYRLDDIAEAARRLDVVARTHPTSEVHFYLGVCRLLLAEHDLAIAELLQARRGADRALARESTWYLAVADERAGRPDAAAAELRTLCGGPGARQAEACAALAGR
jgi:hypothetical protein